MLIVALVVIASIPQATVGERDAFTFLVGAWSLEERLDLVKGTKERGSDRYEFRQPIPGGAIEARWRFNRNTEARPDWAEALYVSGFHEPSQSWSFYYVSERSAQFWAGRKTSGRWYFYFDEPFDYAGRRAIQRQWWEPAAPDVVRRHFENSYDGGKTWERVMTAVLRRVKG